MAYISPSVLPSGTTFAQFQSRGASGHLEALITANLNGTSAPTVAPTINTTGGGSSVSNPTTAITANANGGGRTLSKPSTAVTLSATGGAASGGSLAAGTYYVANTWVTACGGETTVGSSQASVTITTGQIPSVTIPSLPTGATSANIYVGTAAGVLFKYKSGVTGTVSLLDSFTWYNNVAMSNAPSPPTVNSTIGAIPAGSYYAAVTQYNAAGETSIGSSVTSSAFTIAANAAPSGAPTGSGTGTNGNLSPGAYYYKVSYIDMWGNETTGTENASATIITSGQSLVVTFNDTAPDWVVSRNVYLSAAGGASGTETLYATGISPIASTYTCSSALWTNGTTTQSGSRAVLTTATSAAQVPSLTLPGPATGAIGQRVYLSNTNGSNTTLSLYGSTTATTYYMTAQPWNGATFANGTTPPINNTALGNLAAGIYYLRHTELNGFGETNPGPESSPFTIAAGNIPQVTFPPLQTGNVARNLYVTPAGGTSGSEVLYATGITTPTYNMVYQAPSSGVDAPSVAPTIANGTSYGGYLAAGNYYLKNTELNGSGESLAGPESSQFTISAQASPSTPTVSVGGSGGNLVPGNYYIKITGIDATNGGETLPSSESAPFTIASVGQVATVTMSSLPTNISSYKLYCTPTNGASGTEQLYATGIVNTSYAMTAAMINSNVVPPTVNTTTTNQPIVTPPTCQPGNSLRNFYLTPPNGASGTEVLYASMVGTGSFTLSGAAPVSSVTPPAVPQISALAVTPPAVNTTGLTNSKLQLLRLCKHGEFQRAWNYLQQISTVFNQGEPASQQAIQTKFHDVHAVFAILAQLCNEEGALIDANPGHITNVRKPGGMVKQQRVWP